MSTDDIEPMLDLEPLWCARCGRRVMVRPDSAHFSRQLPQCCGVRDWCETQADALIAAARYVQEKNGV